ncbi:MAG: tryptophan--tRNA ligase [Nanoarchaeota archaeon]
MNEKEIEIAEKDYQFKSEQRKKEIDYYKNKMEDIGLKSIDRFVSYCPSPSDYMKNKITYAHMDLERIAEAIADNKPWAVISGLNPSTPLHLGHKAIFDGLLWFQNQGADIFIPITNDESYVVGKSKSLAEARKTAYESIIPSIIAMGFKSEKTKIFVDSDYLDIYNVAMDISNKITLNKALKIFGIHESLEDENPGTMFYRSAVQVAQILLPQYEEFGGPKPTLVPVGIDQHPYITISRNVAEKKEFIPPSEIITKFLLGFDGQGKMSSTRNGSAIFLTDDPNSIDKIVKSAYTGGSPYREYQENHGGIPEICPIWSVRTYHFQKDNNIGEKCSSGKILCGQCKKEAIEEIKDFLNEHQKKLPEARKRIDEFILRTPIKSIFN